MIQFKLSSIFILCLAVAAPGGFAADAPKTTTKISSQTSAAPNSSMTGPNSALQQLVEKQSAASSGAKALPSLSATPSAPVVDPASLAYQNAPETVPATFGGTTPEGGNKWICPRGYLITNGARIPFSETNLSCRKDALLFNTNQAGSCVHNPNSGNPMAGCVTSIGPAPASMPMPQQAPPPPAVDTALQAYQSAPESVPAVSGGTLPDGSRKWICPRGYLITNGARIPFSETNLSCRKDTLLFNLNQCSSCVHNPNSGNPIAGCVTSIGSC